MKKLIKWMALLMAAVMITSGCGTKEAPVETEAETETAAEQGQEEPISVDMSEGLDEEGNVKDVIAADYVTLPGYKNAVLLKEDVTVSEEEIQTCIDNLLSNFTENVEVKDREVAMGDIVNIDYVGSVDGVEFEGGNTQGSGADLEIGSHSYIDTFEDQLVGHKPGEEVKVVVTFPENYGKEELNGKEAVFVTQINHIVETKYPELTDEFVAENLKEDYQFETVEDMRNSLEKELKEDKSFTAVWDWLMDNSSMDQEPEVLVEGLLDVYIANYRQYAQMYGVTLEDLISNYFGFTTVDELRDYDRPEVVEIAKRYLIAQAICDAEGITIGDKELEEYFKGEDPSAYLESYGAGYVKMQVKISRVADLIMETAALEDAPAAEDTPDAEETAAEQATSAAPETSPEE